MKLKNLINEWEKASGHPQLINHFNLELPPYEAARVQALSEMYPGKTPEDILKDLVVAALGELEESMPYVPGYKVISKDDLGEPIYDDIGPNPLYKALTKKLLSAASA